MKENNAGNLTDNELEKKSKQPASMSGEILYVVPRQAAVFGASI